MRRKLAVLLALSLAPCFGAFLHIKPVVFRAVGSDQTNYVLRFAGTYSYLATIANGGTLTNSSGFDAGFYSDSACATKMDWERKPWSATTGAVVFYVRIPTATFATDTTVYLCYANSSITTDQSAPTAVWNSNYKAVWHFDDGTTLSALDSTSNANDGTLVNTPTAAAGQIDGAGSFASASSQTITTASNTNLSLTAITISVWVKATSLPNAYNTVISRQAAGGLDQVIIFVKSDGKLAMYLHGTVTGDQYDGTGSNTLSTGVWYYLTLTYDSTSGLKGYVNGSVDGTDSANGALVSGNAAQLSIGTDLVTAGRYWNGQIDDPEIRDIAIGQDLITTEYNNQLSPSTFYSIGADLVSSRRRPIIF